MQVLGGLPVHVRCIVTAPLWRRTGRRCIDWCGDFQKTVGGGLEGRVSVGTDAVTSGPQPLAADKEDFCPG